MKPGDKIKTTRYWLTYNYNTVKPHTGVFVKRHPRARTLIRVKRDGVKAVENWHEDFWEVAK